MIVGVKTDFSALNPWDVPRLELELRGLWKLLERTGPVDHVGGLIATHHFRGETGAGISIERAESYFRCDIVLNAQRDYFGSLSRRNRFMRMKWILDAYFLSLEARMDFEAGLPPDVRFSPSPAPETTVSSIVRWSRSTYSIDKRTDRFLRAHIRAEDQPVSLSRIALNGSTVDLVRRGLDDIPSIAHKRGSRDEIEIWLRCASSLGATLDGLASLAAAFDETSDWTWVQNRLFDNHVFSNWISDVWPQFHADWRSSLLAGPRDKRVAPPEMVDAVKTLLLRLGVRVLPEPRGLTQFELVEACV